MNKLVWFFRDPREDLDMPIEKVVVMSVNFPTFKGAVGYISRYTDSDRSIVEKCLIDTPISGRIAR